MKILIVSQYFAPEKFKINDLAESLIERGHHIEVLTGLPNYPEGKFYKGYNFWNKSKEIKGNLIIHRARIFPRGSSSNIKLSINYISFVMFGVFKLFFIKSKFDKVFTFAPSPITVGIIGIVAAKIYGAKSYLWVQDLWPESVTSARNIRNKSFLKFLSVITRCIYRFTDIILIQSQQFENFIKSQSINSKKIKYLPNYAEDFYTNKVSIKKRLSNSKFNLMFAGNIGKPQNLELLVEAAKALMQYKLSIKFIIIGEGNNKTYIQSYVSKLKVENYFCFINSKDPKEMPGFFASADCLYLSLKKSPIFSVTIPSKLQTYMASGLPIIGSIDGVSSDIIKSSKSGFSSPSEDLDGLVKNILKMNNISLESREIMGVNALNYYNLHFSKQVVIDNLEQILKND